MLLQPHGSRQEPALPSADSVRLSGGNVDGGLRDVKSGQALLKSCAHQCFRRDENASKGLF